MIVLFQYNQLSGITRRFIENGQYTDTVILLDMGSTSSIFKNNKMLLNISDSDKILRAYMNDGHQDSRMVGYFSGFFKVWFYDNSIVDIYL